VYLESWPVDFKASRRRRQAFAMKTLGGVGHFLLSGNRHVSVTGGKAIAKITVDETKA
jgi:hypothetical protein